MRLKRTLRFGPWINFGVFEVVLDSLNFSECGGRCDGHISSVITEYYGFNLVLNVNRITTRVCIGLMKLEIRHN